MLEENNNNNETNHVDNLVQRRRTILKEQDEIKNRNKKHSLFYAKNEFNEKNNIKVVEIAKELKSEVIFADIEENIVDLETNMMNSKAILRNDMKDQVNNFINIYKIII